VRLITNHSIGRTCLSRLLRSKSLASLRSPLSSTVRSHMKIIALVIALCFVSNATVASEKELLSYFQEKNPDITEVQIIEYVSNYYLAGGLLVARGIKPANTFTGNWNDELFGVFHTRNDLKIIKALEFLPTRRWHDYCAEVKGNFPSTFTVRFYGCSYNDLELTREYKIE